MAHSALHPQAEAGYVSPALSQRAVMFAAIVGLHVVLVYLFASGLAVKTVQFVFEPAEVKFIKEPEKIIESPPPPAPTLVRPREIDLGPPPEGPTIVETDTGTALTPPPAVATAPAAPPVQTHVQPVRLVGKNQLPNTEDYYPPQARRDGIEGATSIQVCVDEQGKRTGDPTILQSSGSALLDKGALDVGRHGRYARATRGGTFVPFCHGFKIIFKMK